MLVAAAIFILCIILVFAGIYFGVTDKAVFYFDVKDLMLSFLPFVIFIILGFLEYFATDNATNNNMVFAALILITLNTLYIIYTSFIYNRGKGIFIILSVGIAKAVLGWIYLFKLLDVFAPSGNNALDKSNNRFSGIIWTLFLSPLVAKLVNGKRVLEKM